MKRTIKCFNSVIFIERQTRVDPHVFSLCYFNSLNYRSLFLTCFSQCLLLLTNAMLGPSPYTTTLLIPVSDQEKKLQYGNFFNSLVIFRHYFTGNGKVSCILATMSNWFLIKRFKNKSCVVVFFSYQTKHVWQVKFWFVGNRVFVHQVVACKSSSCRE